MTEKRLGVISIVVSGIGIVISIIQLTKEISSNIPEPVTYIVLVLSFIRKPPLLLSIERSPFISPFKRFSHSFVEEANKFKNSVFKMFERGEVSVFEQSFC